MNKLLFFVAFLLADRAAAQCPYYATCPTGTPLYCDYSTNDSLYWKAAPFTWNPGLMLSDLPETNVELSIVARDSCGGQNLSVEYTLFLDLDGNDTVETVVLSNALPPSGKVLYNNLLSPNYALGDTIDFDHRTGLPDSMKYRFGLEINRIADLVIANLKWTTGITNPNYSVPKFPLGKHRIQWRIEQGGVERFCEYGFEVKDCAPPVVTCVAPFQVNILPTGSISLWATDFAQSQNDNITPPDLLVMAIRESGVGTGFPVDLQGNPQDFIIFDCCDLGTNEIELWVMDNAGYVSQCTTYVIIQDGIGNCAPDFCAGSIIANASTPLPGSQGIDEVRFDIYVTLSFAPPVSYFNYSNMYGHGVFYHFPLESDFMLTPSKNDNPLNGVTTYDLVLISKHILALEPLNDPNKIIAADVNKSGSVTTFDIVETRKLILGIYDTFPNNMSWRFVDKAFSFPNPINPFQTTFPENIVQQDWNGNQNEFDFVGIKIGDVNNTAIPNASAPNPIESRSPNFLVLPDLELKAGETWDVPIRATKQSHWLGLQFGLDFDPELIEIESVESSALPDFGTENWAQPRPGQVSLSWSDATAATVSPDDPMLQLRIKARANIQLSQALNTTVKPRLQPEVYGLEGVAQPLQVVFSAENVLEVNQVFSPQPNPTTMGTSIPIQISQPENLRVEICDLSGKVLWDNDLNLEKGSHLLEIPAAAMPHAGLYLWRVRVGKMLRAGKITRM
jgi:hypothetical protein